METKADDATKPGEIDVNYLNAQTAEAQEQFFLEKLQGLENALENVSSPLQVMLALEFATSTAVALGIDQEEFLRVAQVVYEEAAERVNTYGAELVSTGQADDIPEES